MAIYTTVDAIARRLAGRLKVSTVTSPTVSPSYNTQQVVDPLLIEQVMDQVEDDLNMTLGQIYVMPLVQKHPILAGIVERLVTAEILQTYYQSNMPPEAGGDPGYGGLLYKQAQQAIAKLTAGHNIMVFGVPSPANVPGVITPQPVVLPGETVQTVQPDTVTRNYTFIRESKLKKVPQSVRRDFELDRFSWNGRARGAEVPGPAYETLDWYEEDNNLLG